MLLHDSRRAARTDATGDIVLLEDQDRGRWDRAQIGEGLAVLERAARMAPPGPYVLQAAIAGVHARAVTAADTRWDQVAALYQQLRDYQPSPVITLNHAVAVALSEGPERGLALIDQIGGLEHYHLYHAARADLLHRLGRTPEAHTAYETALSLATNPSEQRFLQKCLASLTSRPA
jgi:RNA polymerase sigma-70 factor (ECF subfamily)